MKVQLRAAMAAAAAILAVTFAITGCSSKSDTGAPETSATASPAQGDAAALVKQAADVMRQVTGMHVSLVVQGDVPNLSVTKLDGDVSKSPQNAATGTATITVGDKPVDTKFVFADGHLYADVANPGTEYTDYGDGTSIYNVSVLLDPDKGIANLLAKLSDPTAAGNEQINGIATTKITGTSSSNDIAAIVGRRVAPETQTTMPTTVWIASDGTNHTVRVQVDPVPDSSMALSMSEWNKQVTATKPPNVG